MSEPGRAGRDIRSLYVHIPFCERKCGYCDFVTVPGREGEHRYVEALLAELRALGTALPGTELDTVFIGGGTPGYIDPALLAAILVEVRDGFVLGAGAEITMEANPSSTTEPRARSWLAAGVNRISLGVQSLEPEILRFLGRVHDPRRAEEAVAEVRRAGFDAISCDLIYAVPGLDDRSWVETLERIISLDPGHISCYELTVEPGTALHAAVRRGRAPSVDAETALRQHALAVAELGAAGYAQYEVSNFARPGRECRHNLACWRNGYYLAAGVAAHGHVPAAAASALGLTAPAGAESVRYWHTRSLPAYCRQATLGRLPPCGHEAVDAATRETERVMLGLRLSEGVRVRPGAPLTELAAAGLVDSAGGRVRTTPRGQEVLNEIAARLAL